MENKKLFIILGVALAVLLIVVTVVLVLWSNPMQVMKKNEEIENLEYRIEGYLQEINNLRQAVQDTTVLEVIPETSLQTVEGSIVPTFVTIDEKIVFPNKLQLPDSTDDVSNSNIMVGSRFRFVPSDNWLSKMRGSQLDLSHTAKIWGTIKGVAIKERVPQNDMQPLLQEFFKGFPATTITYRKLFIDDTMSGMIASAPITVDDKPYVVTVGFAQRSENAVILLFAYEDDNTGLQKELIDNLIKSGSYSDSRIKLE